MTLEGKGFFIWKVRETENGDPEAVASLAQKANYTHLLIKIADGINSYNVDTSTGTDLVQPLVHALRLRKIQAWGWHYVYGYDPVGEAAIAIKRLGQLNLDGYVIDAEGEYKLPGRATAASTFMSRMRAAYPKLPMALSSYRYPSFHPQLPWKEFLEKCDYNMPQVYWLQNHNPGEQLARSVNEFQALVPFRPIIPTGAAFTQSGWSPTVVDVIQFLDMARSLNLTAANFWEWVNCRNFLPDVWDAIVKYSWPVPPLPVDITQDYIAALNTHDPAKVVALYTPTAVHVTASRTIQGKVAIQAWYDSLFKQVLPNATFTLTGFSGTGSSRHLTWTATSNVGKVQNGNDTLGLLNGKIAYHYTFFTVTKT